MIRVSIIVDNTQFAQGLKHIINFNEGFKTISVHHSCEEAFDQLKAFSPDVLLLDIFLPGRNSIDCIRDFKKIKEDLEIIILAESDNENHIFEALKAGASGYLMKNLNSVQLINSIKTVVEGGAPMSNNIARKVINSFKVEKKEYYFSTREREIITHLVEGKSIKSIAESLFIESSTVKYHLSKIYKKLNVKTKAETISKILKDNLFN